MIVALSKVFFNAEGDLFNMDKLNYLSLYQTLFTIVNFIIFSFARTVVRIHPDCYITFHKAAFLGLNNPNDHDFLKRFLGSMFFGSFVTERGP